MDLNDFRAWHTLVLLAAFIGIIIWAYSRGRKRRFNEAAQLPFADQETHQATMNKENAS